jgi:hypothetical protein
MLRRDLIAGLGSVAGGGAGVARPHSAELMLAIVVALGLRDVSEVAPIEWSIRMAR